MGRAAELAEIASLLADPACRLLTLVGPGGIGKTRLALEAARYAVYPDGVHFVPLQALGAPTFILPAIADSLSLPVFHGSDLMRQLADHLAGRALLLVLDNFEHLLAGAPILSELLTLAPGVRILATSREVLNLQEEWVYAVGGLEYPSESVDAPPLETFSAVQLFAQTARRIRPDFSLADEVAGVLRICALVGGMPLGLELAATWVRALSCAEIAHEIECCLDILETQARNVPTRHRSMRAVLDQSWKLLSAAEQALFKQVSVFRGGFTREAAEAVTGTSPRLLLMLVDKSLLRWHASRYDLHELVRQYAAAQLKDSPEDERLARDRHSAYYAEYLQSQWERLAGWGQKEALLEIDAEIENIRSMWEWAIAQRREADIERALHSLWFYYDTRSLYPEGEAAFDRAAQALAAVYPASAMGVNVGRLLARQGSMCFSLTLYEKGDRLFRESLEILQRHGAEHEMAFTYLKWAEIQTRLRNPIQARRLLERALALYRAHDDSWGTALSLHWLAIVSGVKQGRKLIDESLALNRQAGNRWGVASNLHILSWVENSLGNPAESLRLGRESLEICEDIGLQWGIPLALHTIAEAAFRLGDHAEARRAAYRALELAWRFRIVAFIIGLFPLFAETKIREGSPERALELLALALAHRDKLHLNITDEDFSRLEKQLSPATYRAAVARGKELDLEMTVQALLDERRAATAPGEQAPRPPDAAQALAEPLTDREREILAALAQGLSNREIAEHLVMTVGTIKWYTNQIYSKLGVNSRLQAVVHARALGLID